MKKIDKLISWHKLNIGRWQNRLRIDNYQTLWLSWLKGIVMGIIIMSLLSSCYGTYYLTDAEYSDAREEHTNVTYYNSQVYWGFASGSYYYYGVPHYYPWYYYYDSCPPTHYTHTTHVIVRNPVIRPTHRPNINNHRPNIRTNKNTKVKTNTRVTVTPNTNTKVKTNTNYTRPKTNIRVKTNRTNTNRSNKTNIRKPR